MCFGLVQQQIDLWQANFVYMPKKTVIQVLTEDLSTPMFKEKLKNLDATIVAKCVDPVTQADIEWFVMENTPFGYEDVSTTNTKDPEHAIPDQDDVTTPEQYYEYPKIILIWQRSKGCQWSVTTHHKQDL